MSAVFNSTFIKFLERKHIIKFSSCAASNYIVLEKMVFQSHHIRTMNS